MVSSFPVCYKSTSITEQSEGPVEVSIPEIINNTVHDLVMDESRLKPREIATAVDVSNKRAYQTLHKYLNLKRLLTRLVQPLLAVEK